MGDRISLSIFVDSPSDETLNRCPLALLLRLQYELPFGINIVQISLFFNLTCLRQSKLCGLLRQLLSLVLVVGLNPAG